MPRLVRSAHVEVAALLSLHSLGSRVAPSSLRLRALADMKPHLHRLESLLSKMDVTPKKGKRRRMNPASLANLRPRPRQRRACVR